MQTPSQEVTTFLRVLGCYPREVTSLALRSVDLPDPIADAGAAGQPDALHGSDELLFALASATGRRPQQVRRHCLCQLLGGGRPCECLPAGAAFVAHTTRLSCGCHMCCIWSVKLGLQLLVTATSAAQEFMPSPVSHISSSDPEDTRKAVH